MTEPQTGSSDRVDTDVVARSGTGGTGGPLDGPGGGPPGGTNGPKVQGSALGGIYSQPVR